MNPKSNVSITSSNLHDLPTPIATKTSQEPRLVFTKGQIIQGEIIDLKFNEISLLLEAGKQILRAKTFGNLPLSIGEKAKFLISDDTNKQLTLKYLSQENTSPLDNIIEKAMDSSGIPATNRNRSMIMELLKNQMPIDKHTLQTLAKYSRQYQKVSPATLVTLYKLNLPITKENLDQFESYQERSHYIIDHLFTVIDQIANPMYFDSLDDRITFHQQVLELLIDSNHHHENQIDKDDVSKNGTPPLQQILHSSKEVSNIEFKRVPLSDILTSQEQEDLINLLKNIHLENSHANKDFNEVSNQLKDTGTIFVSDILDFIHTHLPKQDGQVIREITSSPIYFKLMKKAFYQRWTLSPENMTEERIRERYHRLERDIKLLNQILNQKEASKVFLQETETIENNLNFMKSLNELIPYIQLPLHFQYRKVYGELYLISKKKRSTKNTDILDALLLLNLENLGQVNVHIKLKQDKIHADFQMEDKISADLISKNLSELEEALKKKGYAFNSRVQVISKPLDLVKDVLDLESKAVDLKRYTFDIRT